MAQTPSFEPRRRNPRVGPLKLPGEGRQGPPPRWPLAGRTLKAERDTWTRLWATPQAWAWEQLGWTDTVARYCRLLVEASARHAPPGTHAQATALEDRLGLTPKAMRLLLWQIDHGPVEQQETGEGSVASLEDRRQRLTGA
jgi:hypothetical protein